MDRDWCHKVEVISESKCDMVNFDYKTIFFELIISHKGKAVWIEKLNSYPCVFDIQLLIIKLKRQLKLNYLLNESYESQ